MNKHNLNNVKVKMLSGFSVFIFYYFKITTYVKENKRQFRCWMIDNISRKKLINVLAV